MSDFFTPWEQQGCVHRSHLMVDWHQLGDCENRTSDGMFLNPRRFSVHMSIGVTIEVNGWHWLCASIFLLLFVSEHWMFSEPNGKSVA